MFFRTNKALEIQDKKVSIPAERYSALLTAEQLHVLEQLGGSQLTKELSVHLRIGLDTNYNLSLEATRHDSQTNKISGLDLAAKRSQLAATIKQTEAAAAQVAKFLTENSVKRENGLQRIAAEIDAIVDAATNGLIIGKIPNLAPSNTAKPSEFISAIRGRIVVLNALHDCLQSAKDAGAGHQAREVARKQLRRTIDDLSRSLQSTPFMQNSAPEIALLNTIYEIQSHDPFVELKNLREALSFAASTAQTDEKAKTLAIQHDRAGLISLRQAALQAGDLPEAFGYVKALLYRQDATASDLSSLAQICRRQGADDLEFLTLRGMLENKCLSSVSECTRLAELAIKLGVDSPLVGNFLRRLSEVEIRVDDKSDQVLQEWTPENAWQRLRSDLWFEIAMLSRDVKAPAKEGSRLQRLQEIASTYPLPLPFTDPLLKARIALGHNQWNMATQLAVKAYQGATDPMLQQRALLIGLEAVSMTATGIGVDDDNVKNWFEHSFSLGVTPEALQILQAAHAECDVFQLSNLSSKLDELIPRPTYDSLVTQGTLTLRPVIEGWIKPEKAMVESRAMFEAAMALDPTRPEALCGLASIEELSNTARAAQYFEQALTMWPSHSEAQRGLERCQAKLQVPSSYVPNLEVTRPLENPPAELFKAALAYFGGGDHRELAPDDIAKNIRDFLRTKSEAFRKLEEELAPKAFGHKWGAELQGYLGEIVRLAQTIQKRPNQLEWDQLSNLISSQFGPSAAAKGPLFSTALTVLNLLAKRLDQNAELLRAAERSEDLKKVHLHANSYLGKLEVGFGSQQQAIILAEVSAWAQNALKTVQAINSDLKFESAALTVWSERFAATIYRKLRESAVTQQPTPPPSRKRKLGKQSSNPNSDSPEIVLTR
jgi:hypothetical protein